MGSGRYSSSAWEGEAFGWRSRLSALVHHADRGANSKQWGSTAAGHGMTPLPEIPPAIDGRHAVGTHSGAHEFPSVCAALRPCTIVSRKQKFRQQLQDWRM